MWFLIYLLVIKPEAGEFRTKNNSLEDEIKAYILLERNSQNNSQNQKENHEIRENTITFIEAPIENKIENKTIETRKQEKNILKAIKQNKKLYWNNGLIEY